MQAPRVHTTLTPADPFPNVDMVPPSLAVDQEGENKEELISHRTPARRTTSIPYKPLPLSPDPVEKCTRSQTMEPRQAAQRRFPQEFILYWSMPIMENITGKTLEHCQLRRHPR